MQLSKQTGWQTSLWTRDQRLETGFGLETKDFRLVLDSQKKTGEHPCCPIRGKYIATISSTFSRTMSFHPNYIFSSIAVLLKLLQHLSSIVFIEWWKVNAELPQ